MPRVLFIPHRMPYPPDKGDRVRAFHEIVALQEHFDVTVACGLRSAAEREAGEALAQHAERVLTVPVGSRLALLRGGASLLAGRSVTEGYFHSPALARRIRQAADEGEGGKPFDIVMGYCSSTLGYVTATPATVRIMDLVDVDSAKWSAYARTARWPKRWLYALEGRRVAGLERRAAQRCDATLLVSDDEARAMGLASEKVIGLPNGVDVDYFQPADRPAEAPPTLVFTGTMDYRPNIEGVSWFAHNVLPLVRARVPDAEFVIVGRDPTPAVQQLAQIDGVTVTGSVPDVRPYLHQASLAVVPLHLARGIQNKVLEAMACGRAVVATGEALEGIEADIGSEVIQAEQPDQWCETICALLTDADRRSRIETLARERVARDYTWPARMAPLVALCRRLLGRDEDTMAREDTTA